jgi:hypothetical protein
VEASVPSGQRSVASVLFSGPVPDPRRAPEHFPDLRLDAVLAALVRGRQGYGIEEIFVTPLRGDDEVRDRQEVFRDLERGEIREAVDRFSEGMEEARRRRSLAESRRHPLERRAWLLDAMEAYCAAVRALEAGLLASPPRSRNVRRLGAHLSAYTESGSFRGLEAGTEEASRALRAVEYALRIHGTTVTVAPASDEPDLGAAVLETFARFRRGAATREATGGAVDPTGLSQVETRIVELVAEQHPEPFRALEEHCAHYGEFVEPTIGRFHRDAQFVLAYLDLMAPLRAAGLPFCNPAVDDGGGDTRIEDAFDIALAIAMAPAAGDIVLNDVRLEGSERALIVSGPNNGGKTTYARMVGQLHHLASIGVPIPARTACVPLADRIFTHFARAERVESLRGKLEDELLRVKGILDDATPASVIVMNESFGSTSLEDARVVGAAILRRIIGIGATCVYVTFIEELAALGDETVSMVSQVEAGDPATRTYRVVRTPPDGLAYAWAVAERHGLSYDRLMEVIGA